MYKNELITMLEKENTELQRMRRSCQSRLESAPEGVVHAHKTRTGSYEYYMFGELDGTGKNGEKYISKNQMKLIEALVQKEYDSRMKNWLDKAIAHSQALLKCYKRSNPELIYNKLNDGKKKLIVPSIKPIEQFVVEWEKSKTTGQNTIDIDSNIYTEKGEHVRSKSEKILADKFYVKRIPYVYEPLVLLADGRHVFPDFVILNVNTRKEYLFEHFGMMDNNEYCKRAIEKIERYQKNGIMLGRELLCTFETSDRTMDNDVLNSILARYLI